MTTNAIDPNARNAKCEMIKSLSIRWTPNVDSDSRILTESCTSPIHQAGAG